MSWWQMGLNFLYWWVDQFWWRFYEGFDGPSEDYTFKNFQMDTVSILPYYVVIFIGKKTKVGVEFESNNFNINQL